MIVIESYGIGIGKTELSKQLHEALEGAVIYPEKVDHPYLPKFYEDVKNNVKPSHVAFAMQFYLMGDRYFKHLEATDLEWRTGRQTIHDRSIFGDNGFAHKLWKDGFISKDDYNVYMMHRKTMEQQLLTPQVVIKLNASPETCIKRIKERMAREGLRTCECAVTVEYLEGLRESYEAVVWPWFSRHAEYIIEYDWEDYKPLNKVLSDVLPHLPGGGRMLSHSVTYKRYLSSDNPIKG